MVCPSGTDSPGYSRTKGRKTVVVEVVVVVVVAVVVVGLCRQSGRYGGPPWQLDVRA